ncbi:SpoIIE family protein phosphatase [Bacillaceae bacterium SIJ1]|uniref:PP2C family serine/threonine-protein phosphatase n=1 Tax=Litoribacterium kuwaitense TaxID=1398745 RepID=UPI0013EA8302|nr:PP2C family serine/threonine-protein phosphatase [Litoribacterium kuwaitense]NGP46242.1 SpoIIE family protein phosphatase [Litoribacterium kuwaitense]
MIHEQFNHMEVYAFQKAKHNDQFCGDSYFFTETDEYFLCALADGLGSGKEAHESSMVAIAEIKAHYEQDSLEGLVRRANEAMKQMRGAVLTIFKMDFVREELTCISVGNIRLFVHSSTGKLTYPLPQSGYLSGRHCPLKIQTFPCEKESSFLIHSDGLDLRSPRQIGWRTPSIEEAYRLLLASISEDPPDDVTFLLGRLAK